jgi:hypothetical protein
MKKIIFIGLTSVLCFISNAQQLSNGSLSGTCTGNGFTAPSCIKGWYSSHGNPTVLGNSNTNTWAWLSISKDNSDGIFTDYNFIIGKKYQISFKIKTLSTVGNSFFPMANVIATTGLKGSSSRIPVGSENNETIWSKGVNKKTNGNWQTVTITYTPTKSNAQLWFYPSVEYISKLNENGKVQMEIDDIEVNSINDNLVSNNLNSTIQPSATAYIVPNPAYRGQLTKLFINPNEVNEVALINVNGDMKKLNFIPLDTKTISFILDFTTSRGFHTLEVVKKNGSILTKKLIVE